MLLLLFNQPSGGPPPVFVLSQRWVDIEPEIRVAAPAANGDAKMRWPAKDPDDITDFDVDWTQRLYDEDELALVDAGTPPDAPADTVASSTFILPDQTGSDEPLVADSTENTETRTKVWLSGGVIGSSYEIINRVTTAGGRTMDQTIKLRVKTK